METQDILKKETGTIETIALKPAKVKIVDIKVDNVDVKGKQKEKVVLVVKHPDNQDTIEISAVKFEKKGKLISSGLWVSLDDDGNLQKGSALVNCKDFYKCKTLEEMREKEADTVEDDKGFLVIKAY